MSADWIKMRVSLWDSPQVVRVVALLKSGKPTVCGALYRLWSLGDQYTTDGRLAGYTAETLNETVGVPGFAEALASVGWLICESDAVVIRNFEDHNGQSAKRRAQERDRKQLVRSLSASDADNVRTRGRGEQEGEGEEKVMTSDLDGAKCAFEEEKRRELLPLVKRIAKVIRCRHHNDKSLVVKVAWLGLDGQFSLDDLEQSLEAVRLKGKDNPASFFHKCMENKARDFGRDFRQLLASVSLSKSDVDELFQTATTEANQ